MSLWKSPSGEWKIECHHNKYHGTPQEIILPFRTYRNLSEDKVNMIIRAACNSGIIPLILDGIFDNKTTTISLHRYHNNQLLTEK
jgi:hypothetical protein